MSGFEIVTGLSALASAAGAVGQGMQAQKQGRFQAALARQQAVRARERAALEERRAREASDANLARLRARLGAAGVTATSGSALLLQQEQAGQGELEALLARTAGADAAAAQNARAQADIADGNAAFGRGLLGAGTTLLDAAPQVFPKTFGRKGSARTGSDLP